MGGFPALTGWWVNTLGLHSAPEAIAAAAAVLACFWLTKVQRRLSTPVRQLRRRTLAVDGEQRLTDGTVQAGPDISPPRSTAPSKASSVAVPLLAVFAVAIGH